jgi:16S rRNA processing protein RimM
MQLIIGRVAKSHGIRGEVLIDVRTDEPEQRFAIGTVLRGRRQKSDTTTEYTVTAAREHSGRLLVSLSGVTDRDTADALRGLLFVIDTADLVPSDDPDEFYDHELEGLPVRLIDGTPLGTVTEVLHSAAGELLSIRSTDDGREILVPFVTAIVPQVSVTDGIVVDPPDGLLDV